MRASWTPDRIDRMRSLAAAGWSASEIAKDLGDVTRSSVFGKAMRCGVSLGRDRKVAAVARAPRQQELAPIRTKPLPVAKPVEPRAPIAKAASAILRPAPDVSLAVSILNVRDGQCRFPLWGDRVPPVRTAMVCGARTVSGEAWCRHHLARVTGRPAYGQSDKSTAQATDIAE